MKRHQGQTRTVDIDALSTAEKEAMYRECEKVGAYGGKPLTKADRRLHERARRRGRPRVGAGAKRIQVTMERGLLRRTDAFVRRHGMSRAEFLAKAVEAMLAKAG